MVKTNMLSLSFLSHEDIQAIHDTTLAVLSDVGIALGGDEALALLLEHGAVQKQDRICIPPELVTHCVSLCPQQVVLEGRGSIATLGGGELHVHNLGGARDVLDHPDGSLRPAAARDVAEAARLLDALESATTITPFYTPRDVPPKAMVPTMFAQTVSHTLKPINGPGVQDGREARTLAEMIKVVFGDQAKVSLGVSPVSPLGFPKEISGGIIEVARQGLPLGPLPCPQVGVSAPMTLAGALALQNAEVLAAIVLAQLVTPGLPIIYCGRLAVVDMRSVMPIWGNPEIGIMSAATVQLAHYYHLPVNVYGLCGSGHAVDIQSGYERAINALLPTLAGADELSGIGEMAGGTFSCAAQMVIDDEIIGAIHRVRRGIVVSEETLALEVTARVMGGPMKMYLGEGHTITHMRNEVWLRTLGTQGVDWQGWADSGRETIVDRAQAKAQQILADHEVPPLPDDQSRELERILQSVSQEEPA
jgi:trimethylamine--corrinoid protein Co-methyltransferase